MTLEPGANNIASERIRALRSPARSAVAEKMATVRAGYFGTEPDHRLDHLLDNLFDDYLLTIEATTNPAINGHLARQAEGYVLLSIGPPGTRKTSTMRRAIFRRPEFEGYSDDPILNTSPLVSIVAPSPCTLRQLGIAIATALGYSPRASIEENAVWKLVNDNLPVRGVRFIHIDEMQHVTQNKNVAEIPKIQNTLKRLLQSANWPVWLLLTGLPEIGELFESDTQIWRRAEFLRFETLQFQRDASLCRAMVDMFAAERAGLDPSIVNSDEFIHRLMHASLFRLGIAIDIVLDAIQIALREDSASLTAKHFAEAFRVRTGADTDNNVFALPGDFTSVQVAKFFSLGLAEQIPSIVLPNAPKQARGKRNK